MRLSTSISCMRNGHARTAVSPPSTKQHTHTQARVHMHTSIPFGPSHVRAHVYTHKRWILCGISNACSYGVQMAKFWRWQSGGAAAKEDRREWMARKGGEFEIEDYHVPVSEASQTPSSDNYFSKTWETHKNPLVANTSTNISSGNLLRNNYTSKNMHIIAAWKCHFFVDQFSFLVIYTKLPWFLWWNDWFFTLLHLHLSTPSQVITIITVFTIHDNADAPIIYRRTKFSCITLTSYYSTLHCSTSCTFFLDKCCSKNLLSFGAY